MNNKHAPAASEVRKVAERVAIGVADFNAVTVRMIALSFDSSQRTVYRSGDKVPVRNK